MSRFLSRVEANSFKKLVKVLLTEQVAGWNRIEEIFPRSTIDTAYELAWQHFGKGSTAKHPAVYQSEAQKAAEFVIQYFEMWSDLAFPENSEAMN